MKNITVKVNVPESATKQLKMKSSGGRRKITVSSNWLTLFDFPTGARVTERSLGAGKGMVVERVYDDMFEATRTNRVYERRYTRRVNNPLEAQLEVASQKLIDESFGDAQHVHVAFKKGRVTLTPIITVSERAQANATTGPIKVFGVCTSGVDLFSMQARGWHVCGVLDWRPPEARDFQRRRESCEIYRRQVH